MKRLLKRGRFFVLYLSPGAKINGKGLGPMAVLQVLMPVSLPILIWPLFV